VILDTRLNVPEDAQVIRQKSTAPTIVVTGPDVPSDKKARLLKKNVQVMEIGLKNNRLDLCRLMLRLGELSITSLLIEGGGTVAADALAAGIVNKMVYFLAPRVLGGSDGKAVFEGKGVEKLSDAVTLDPMTVTQVGQDILVQGYVNYPDHAINKRLGRN
jgi:diaminohydroxyphosphoribosylaminopyrimidine deaminase/5-amino-6-(5-phosphoribosylamino)uracil reductase